VAEAKPLSPRSLQLEYRFDRLLSDKLAQAFQLLVPDQRRPVSTPVPNCAPQSSEVSDEQTSCDLRSGLFRSPEGESHDPLGHLTHQFVMIDSVEKFLQIQINHPAMPLHDILLRLRDRLTS
jgi:hypothetical protein